MKSKKFIKVKKIISIVLTVLIIATVVPMNALSIVATTETYKSVW